MTNKHKFHRKARDEALTNLIAAGAATGKLPAETWQSFADLSGYSIRHLKRLVEELSDGSHTDPIPGETGFTIDSDVITAVFLTCGNLASAHRLLVREGTENLPSPRHFARCVVQQMGTTSLQYARGGSISTRETQIYLPMRKVTRGHTLELDHAELPIWVVPDSTRTPVRPWLTTALDVGTRYPLSWVITFGSPSSAEVRACLVQAMTVRVAPDGQTLVGGVPMRAVWDRGLEFLAEVITQSCMRLQVIPVALPAYSPQLKPHIERFQGFLKRDALPSLPGYTDGGTDVRGRSAIASAALGESEFLLKVADWIDWYITEHVHASLGCTPLEAWQRDGTVLREAPAAQLWEDFLAQKKGVKVSKNGVRFDTIDFVSGELNGYVGRKVEVRYLPHDRTFVEIFIDGVHLCTAYPRNSLTEDQDLEVKHHRQAERAKAQARFSTANRQRRSTHETTQMIERDKKGKMVVRQNVEAADDLLSGGDEALADLLTGTPDEFRLF